MRDEGTCSTASGSSLPDYDRVGQLGEPPQYQNTESAAKHRTRQDRHLPVFTDEGLPPTYESLYGAIKEEWFTSENFTEFLQKAGAIFLASLSCTLILLVLLILPLAYIIIGAIFIDKCPVNRMIPVYLIIAGILGLLQNGLMLMRKQVPNNEVASVSYRVCEGILMVVSFIWFLLGSIWVYSVVTRVCFKDEDEGHDCYCNSVCYWFAFVMITLTYIFIVLVILVMCCVVGFSVRYFERRRVEDSGVPAICDREGYAEIRDDDTAVPEDPTEAFMDLTRGLFLGEGEVMNYRSTEDGHQPRPDGHENG